MEVMPRTAVVTGAFGNIGAAAAAVLAARGWRVVTLTNRPAASASVATAHPLRFHASYLRGVIAGAEAFVNTYWVRLPSHGAGFEEAVANSRLLAEAARDAGVARFVQVSVTHASPDSPSPYYAGKARVDTHVAATFRSHAVVRPTLVVGPKDVLTGNMAWFLRRSPVIPVPKGEHPVQPVTLDDVGRLIADRVEAGDSGITEAAGPERFTFRGWLELLARALGLRRRFFAVPASLFLAATGLAGLVLRDTVVSRDELRSLARGSLVPEGPPTCPTPASAWLMAHGRTLGIRFVNDRRDRRPSARAARPRPAPAGAGG